MQPDPALAPVADRSGLGPFVSLHRGPKDMLKLALGSLALGVALASYYFWQDFVPEGQRDEILGYALPAAGGLFIVVGIVGFLRLKGRALQFHEHGLVYKEGSKVRPLRFADVIAVDLDITETSSNTGTSYSGRLAAITRDGQSFSIQPNIDNLDDVIRKLVRGSAASVIPGVVGELRAGRSVPSGAFTLQPDGIAGRDGLIPWTEITNVDEESDMSMLTDNTKVALVVRGRGDRKLRAPAGKVRNRSYLAAIANAMQPPAKESNVSMTGATLSAMENLDPAVGKAMRPLMGAHWRAAKLVAETNDDGDIQNLYVIDPTTNEAAAPSPELVEVVRRVFALHQEQDTGVDRYILTLSPTPDGKWSISSQMASQADD